MTDNLRIDGKRLYESVQKLGMVGRVLDDRTGMAKIFRLALSDEDHEARRLVKGWFEEAGLEVSVDQIGNVYGQREGTDNSLTPVMAGSHLDSVPSGGRFDGALGVLAALEVIRTLNDHDIRTRRPLVAAIFTEEEGCRFRTDMLGSAVATGRIPLDAAYALTDSTGRTVRQELLRTDHLGTEEVCTRRPHAYVECHVEQGPVLIRSDQEVGVVTGVQAISWWELRIEGKPAHAGTTPISCRSDAGLVASMLNVHLREMAESGHYGELRGTMGSLRFEPGAINVIPGSVLATVDLRNPDDEMMTKAEQAVRSYTAALAEKHGVEIHWSQRAKTPMVAFDDSVQQIIAGVADDLGLRHSSLIAGAGHDAQEWARICKTAMVFVPGENDGISHNPMEHSTQKQCADGANVLMHTLRRLANES